MKTNGDRFSWTRREFMAAAGGTLLAGGCQGPATAACKPRVTFGIVTDCHYAERDDPQGMRAYRESDEKLAECVADMNRQKVDFLIELGDFKDQGDNASQTLDFLRTIEAVFNRFEGPRYHVLGNHDMDRISKEQFLANISNTGFPRALPYYSFDAGGIHFVALDANCRADGSDYNAGNFDWRQAFVAAPQLEWLAADLAASRLPVIVFVHHRLDADQGEVYARNAADVRRVLETSGRVRAVFQGHHHEGGYRCVNAIHYYTLKALVVGRGLANTAYATVQVMPDNSLNVTGFKNAESLSLA